MGDRRLLAGTNDRYFGMLEALMGSITDSVLRRKLAPPLFHVFSETLQPCPSEVTGAFGEFPNWPVELTQVRCKGDLTKRKENCIWYPFEFQAQTNSIMYSMGWTADISHQRVYAFKDPTGDIDTWQ